MGHFSSVTMTIEAQDVPELQNEALTYGDVLPVINSLNTKYQSAVRYLIGMDADGNVKLGEEPTAAMNDAILTIARLCADLRKACNNSLPNNTLSSEDQRKFNIVIGILNNYTKRAEEKAPELAGAI